MADLTTDNETKKSVLVFAKDAAQKLILIPHVIMFMPMDLILRPGAANFGMENYGDARDKIHNKSSLKLLFDEDDMDWIISMIFFSEDADAKPLLYFSAIAGAAFGSIHCAAWNFEFPSHVEQIMWRTASLTLVGICLSIIVGTPIWNWDDSHLVRAEGGSTTQRRWELYERTIELIPAVIYPIARLTLLVLALLSLRHLPDSALQTVTWTKFIPHI